MKTHTVFFLSCVLVFGSVTCIQVFSPSKTNTGSEGLIVKDPIMREGQANLRGDTVTKNEDGFTLFLENLRPQFEAELQIARAFEKYIDARAAVVAAIERIEDTQKKEVIREIFEKNERA